VETIVVTALTRSVTGENQRKDVRATFGRQLQDYLAKGPYRRGFRLPGQPGSSGHGIPHKYAHAYLFGYNFSAEGYINTWKSYV
jgi:hypothetical protein